MGLNEKRILIQFKKQFEEELAPKLRSLGGLSMEIEIDWNAIALAFTQKEAMEERLQVSDMERLVHRSFVDPVTAGILLVAKDDLGRSAIRDSLKKIVYRTDGNSYGPDSCFEFTNLTLVVNQWDSDEYKSTKMGEKLAHLIESAL